MTYQLTLISFTKLINLKKKICNLSFNIRNNCSHSPNLSNLCRFCPNFPFIGTHSPQPFNGVWLEDKCIIFVEIVVGCPHVNQF